MIGQKSLKELINNQIEISNFPKFSIIVGRKGQGKHTLVNYISEKLDIEVSYVDNKVESIRNFIKQAYEKTTRILYVLDDIDSAHIDAKNAILKIIEEPVRNCHIILLSENKQALLPTIISRGVTYELEPYTEEHLKEYCKLNKIGISEEHLKFCSNIGDILDTKDEDISGLKELTDNIILNISKATLGNALMISNKIKISDTDTGYTVNLFMNSLEQSLLEQAKAKTINNYIELSEVIVDIKNRLKMRSSNKKMIIDELIIRLWRCI